MNKITYEGTKYDSICNDDCESVRVVISDINYKGNVAGLALMISKELIDFDSINKPDLWRIQLSEINTSLYFRKDNEISPDNELSFYIAISQALQEYLVIYHEVGDVSQRLREIQNEGIMRVNEMFLNSTICAGGLFDYV